MKIIIMSLCILGLMACATRPDTEKTLMPYLNEFIGKDIQHVKQHMDLQQFNFNSTNQPYLESNQRLIYRILRPVRISAPIPITTAAIGSGMQPSTKVSHSLPNSYNVDFNCDIQFNLKDNNVVDWKYTGKAC